MIRADLGVAKRELGVTVVSEGANMPTVNAGVKLFVEAKVLFGPHIFPDAAITPNFQPEAPVFFGALNDRRRGLLADLQAKRPVEVAPHGTFGRPLDALIAKQGAVLNLHFREGQYSEYPRFLKAYVRGKPVQSVADQL